MTLGQLLQSACRLHASDLVLAAGAAPTVWVHGRMRTMDDWPTPLEAGAVGELFAPLLSDDQRDRLQRCGDLDWSASLDGLLADEQEGDLARIRVNLHRQRGDLAAAVRFISRHVPTLESLNLPAVVGEWVDLPRGLVLVTGPTGAGKSTTLAAMVQQANRTHDYHVITLEDPIEYQFEHGRCLIEQRQIGEDCPGFAEALRHVVRQRPDVILVGEMRDRETIAAALTAAETGHLVLATLHTSSAPATLARIIDVFDHERQGQIRLQLAGSLQCILCQCLLPDRLGGGVVPATEVLIAGTAIRRAIRDGAEHQIDAMLETGGGLGMHSLEQDLARLVDEGRIALDDAAARCDDVEKLNRRLGSQRAPDARVRGGRR
ncbi:MAG: Twitching mobility protein [Phycisphaerae bacterium]|nr:Twitching mobility protein [Phycisphaerae bacterium]